jgi:hypothetical protein
MNRTNALDNRKAAPSPWKRASLVAALLGASAAMLVATAAADAPPVGPLPKTPATTGVTQCGSLVAVALPRQRPSTGHVWRLARAVDSSVLRQVSEADVGNSTVIIFRAIGSGSARIAFALTGGETGTKAIRAATYTVRVR